MKVLANISEKPKIATKSAIDEILGGGIEIGNITQLYGPPGSGKTNVSLKLAVEVAKSGKKVIFIDTEGGISIDRIKQIAKGDFDLVANNIIVFEPHSFAEQEDDLKTAVSLLSTSHDDIDLIVLDSAVALYRLDDSKSSKINKELGRQMKLLSSVSRKYDVAVLITNQIYSTFDSENNGDIRPIGGDVLKYWSKVIIELEKSDVIGQRIATLKRHRSMPEGISCNFRITSHGIY